MPRYFTTHFGSIHNHNIVWVVGSHHTYMVNEVEDLGEDDGTSPRMNVVVVEYASLEKNISHAFHDAQRLLSTFNK